MRLLILIICSSLVLASDLGIGSTMEQMIQSSSFRFMLVFMLFFLLLYAIFLASIAKVSVFKGKGSLPSKQGKVVALSLGLMGAFGVSYWANYSSAEFVTRVLSVAGWFGAIAVAFLAGAVAWKSKFGNWGYPTLVAGIAFLTYGVLIGNDWAIGLGNILIVAGIIGLIFWVFSSDGSGSGNNANNSNQGGGNGNNGNGNNGGNGNDGGDDESDGSQGIIPDYKNVLDEIERLLDEYDSRYNQFVNFCNDVLQTNHDFLRSIGGYTDPYPQVTEDQLQRVMDSIDSLNELMREIIQYFNEIVNDSNFTNISESQHERMTNLQNRQIRYVNRTQQFRSEYVRKYQEGEAP